MGVKIYNKRGSKNYKEKRMIEEIESAIGTELENNPELAEKWVPASNFDELETLYNRYSEEITDVEDMNENDSEAEESNDSSLFDDSTDFQDEGKDFIDPFNREAPIVRDYVTDKDPLSEDQIKEDRPLSSFNEPLSFKEAFEIPDNGAENNTDKGGEKTTQESTKQTSQEPINPEFDTMSGGKKKRSTKKFAKYIVETVCMLSEKGFVWYANNEINENKLTEYEMSGEMDLSLLVSLEDGQEVTCKQFFQVQCAKAEQLCKIDEEEKADLAEALAEVLMEKGIGPTPTQELILISLKIFGSQAINLMALKSQTNSLLTQLRGMNEGYAPEQGEEYEPLPVEEEYQEPEKTPPPPKSKKKKSKAKDKELPSLPQAVIDSGEVIESTLETKE